MKLIRFGEAGKEKPGIFSDGQYFDVSSFCKDYNEDFFREDGLSKLAEIIASNNLNALPGSIRLGCPVSKPSKIVCIGLNYADHAKETGAATPPEPVIFLKSTTAVCGPFDDIVIPKNSVKN